MNRADRKRLFFALNPSRRVRAEVAALQRDLGVQGRAVPPENFHVTLAFLGMQDVAAIPDVCEVAASVPFPSCEVVLDRQGRFKRAGVLWLGASELSRELAGFQHRLVDALLAAGIGYDRKPWKLHLTLYRKLRTPPPTMAPVAVRWRLDGFSLVESVSVNRGVIYRDIARWKAVS
ncbi:MAG: RNA 2',3'-cyclic phosphodiesterase [Xanthomonadales bacterium]|nr:RNA 2',3'-cyclic phosphodiesterase [Gammaproteobacteria bacterium]MBT8051485.1 RNA 2',3'-cyclic phosphodiesterase [Gammaproteobacteria bacterium]MBT8055641.1 RNA 2',3'-cyclic phosphodiesterase [Gammaproteobacteria bacterium]NNJ79576.1 RNA 2',3'-cyclic phosphodiesterase [Xanthomonadales bacterium]NNL05457.1 RNA 2',3'-cyclic phosphodiesterase [Xanthomonadales bacterium]